MVILGPYVTEWKRLYPSNPFPSPNSPPPIFPNGLHYLLIPDPIPPVTIEIAAPTVNDAGIFGSIINSVTNTATSIINTAGTTIANTATNAINSVINNDCQTGAACPNGLLDYQCQINNNCYMNLVNLGIHLLGFVFAAIFLLIVSGYAFKIVWKLLMMLLFLNKVIQCIGSCVKCCSLGFFEQKVYHKDDIDRKRKELRKDKREIKIEEGLAEIDVEVVAQRLDSYQKKRILQLIDDYQITSDNKNIEKT